MRLFAGPNGSGKSSVIEYVKKQKVDGFPIDFGIYVNADDIAKSLRENTFSFHTYEINITNKEFQTLTLASGLINNDFTEKQFISCYTFSNNKIKLNSTSSKKQAYIIRMRG
jgi:predicted ABC-type ATPase